MKILSLPKNIGKSMRLAFPRAQVKGVQGSKPETCIIRFKGHQILHQPEIVGVCRPFFIDPVKPPKGWNPSIYLLVKEKMYVGRFINISGHFENGMDLASYKTASIPTEYPSIYLFYKDIDMANGLKPNNFLSLYLTYDPNINTKKNVDLILKNIFKCHARSRTT